MIELLKALRWKYYENTIFGVNSLPIVCIHFDASIIAIMIEDYEIARELRRLTDIKRGKLIHTETH